MPDKGDPARLESRPYDVIDAYHGAQTLSDDGSARTRQVVKDSRIMGLSASAIPRLSRSAVQPSSKEGKA